MPRLQKQLAIDHSCPKLIAVCTSNLKLGPPNNHDVAALFGRSRAMAAKGIGSYNKITSKRVEIARFYAKNDGKIETKKKAIFSKDFY